MGNGGRLSSAWTCAGLLLLACSGSPQGRAEGGGGAATSLLPLVGGEPDEGHPAVGMVLSEFGACTGTLISPHMVLTAAHCVNSEKPPQEFRLGGDGWAPLSVHAVVQSFVHPDYGKPFSDPQLGQPHDLALLLLSEPAAAVPMAMRLSPLDCMDGAPVEYVGYGKTSAIDPASSGKKNHLNLAIGKVVESGFWSFTFPGAPKNACPGDSGGPAFIRNGQRQEVAGVLSLADKWCEWETFAVRLDVHASWLMALVNEHDPAGLPAVCGDGYCEYMETADICPTDCTAGTAALGGACSQPGECKSGLACVAAGLPGVNLCTLWCSGPFDGTGCPCGYACVPHPSAPSPDSGVCTPLSLGTNNCGDTLCTGGEDASICAADCAKAACNDVAAAGCCADGVAAWCGQDGKLSMADCAGLGGCGWNVELGRYGCGNDGEVEPSGASPFECPPPGPQCANGLCEEGETPESCPVDCLYPGYCGDEVCNGTEDFQRCPKDCLKEQCDFLPVLGCCTGDILVYCYMGDQQMVSCQHHPGCGWSLDDGAYSCGTEGGEDPEGLWPRSCEAYKASECGDSHCDAGETFENCPEDCEAPPPGCGDGLCSEGEDYTICPADCFASGCGNIPEEGCCTGDLAKWCIGKSLFMDHCGDEPSCGWSVEDGFHYCGTDGGSDPAGVFLFDCADVATAFCGDGKCHGTETKANCPKDCKPPVEDKCGDGTCQANENELTCPADCAATAEPTLEPVPDVAGQTDTSAADAGDAMDVADGGTKKKGGGGGCSAAPGTAVDWRGLALMLLVLAGAGAVVRRRAAGGGRRAAGGRADPALRRILPAVPSQGGDRMAFGRMILFGCVALLLAAACSGKGKQEVPGGDCCPPGGEVLADAADVATPPADVAPGEGVEVLLPDVVPGETSDLVVVPEVTDLVVPPDAADTLDGQTADHQSTELPPGCCYKDEDCDTGVDMAFVCGFLTPASDQGVCLPLPQPGECWDKGDCKPGEDCQGPTFCECGTLCGQIQAPGKCDVLPTPEVCKVDSQCPDGTRCVGKPFCDGPPGDCPDLFGTCLPLTPGLCWGDVDCVAGQVCVNAVYCQGGKVCLVDEHPGVCLDAALNGCWADGDCAPPINGTVFRCTGQWVIPWWTGNDYDAELDQEGECCGLKPGTCYEDEDCLAGQECQNAMYPYTGACSDDADDEQPGQCVDLNPWPDELCATDAECNPGESCIGEWTCPAGTLCLDPEYPGLCLEDPVGALEWCYEIQMCGQGKSCGGPWVCDVIGGEMCGGIMATPGQCQPISYPPADLGEPCGPDGGQCKAGLACCYPCGIQGCLFTCSVPCDPDEPSCSGGCSMMP